jgi:hypothetical protein
MSERELPKYVMMGGRTALRLEDYHGATSYYRIGGAWRVGARWEGDKLVSTSRMEWLDGIELTETTKREWWEDNYPYAGEKYEEDDEQNQSQNTFGG